MSKTARTSQTANTLSHQLAVERIDYRSAKKFFASYEHLGDCGLGVWHYGAFDNSTLIGVVSFGTPCFAYNRGVLSSVAADFGLHIYQLSRGGTVPFPPLNTPSRVLAAAMKCFFGEKGDSLVVAYADRDYNEVGTIYQACNALYTGQTEPKNQSNYVINGRRMTAWSVRKKFGTRSMDRLKTIDKEVTKIPLSRKYRYLFVLASHLKKRVILNRLAPMVLPYPKRITELIASMDIETLILNRDLAPGNGPQLS